ncbi:MAG: hypothetical protein ACI9OJ_005819, partial [Myxococcota bacterium]
MTPAEFLNLLNLLPASLLPLGLLTLAVACAPSAPPSVSNAPRTPTKNVISTSESESIEVAPRYQAKADRSMESIVAETLANSTYRPSERALKARSSTPTSAYATVKAPLAVQVGEIVVLEGDETTVSDLGDGDYGVVLSNFVQNPLAITSQFYQSFPDEFDAVTIFTTFPDGGSQGSVAWYLPIRLSVGGVGATQVDNGQAWGSTAALHGFINMQYVGQYGTALTDPTSYVHTVMAQEFGHRWGSFAQYINGANELSNAMLGRDGSHWASTLQANGSVMDGNELQEISPGNFRVTASNYRFSELDQYIMGLRGPEEVPDWFVVNDAVRNGNLINPEFPLQVGTTFSGTRENITIEQVIKAHGARNPDHLAAQKDFRLAVVLVTRPGETADDVSVFVDRLEQFRLTFEQAAAAMSDKRMRVCTQVSAPCDSPRLSLAGVEFSEEQGNGDGEIDPGEVIRLKVSVSSTGFGEATNVSVGLGEVDERVRVIQQTVSMDNIPEGETLTAADSLLIRVPYDEGCGGQITIPLRLITEGRNFPAETAIEVGIDRIVLDTLEDPEGWTINPYGTDT